MSSPHSALDQTIALVKAVASIEIMPRFLRVGYERKGDGSLFTEADVAAQTALVHGLQAILPFPVLGEEMSDEQHAELWARGDAGLWCIDPIDGTTNFIHGLPYFAVSVALMQQGRPVLGVIYNPVSNEMFYASQGAGAYVNGQRLPLKYHTPRMADAIAGVEPKWLGGRLPARLMSIAPYGSQRNLGASTLDWCYLAAGRYDLYLHGGQRLWDYAAGSLILAEAGGRMRSLHRDNYWEDDLWQRSAVAALDPDLYQKWVAWVMANR